MISEVVFADVVVLDESVADVVVGLTGIVIVDPFVESCVTVEDFLETNLVGF